MNLLSRKHWLAMVVYGTTMIASAQDEHIHGIVVDGNTEEPLYGAAVYVLDLQVGVQTDESGAFHIDDLPLKELEVQISYLGYETEMVRMTPGVEADIPTIQLFPTIIEGHDVIVSAPYPSTQDESPVKVEQRSMKELNETGSPSLAQSLSTIPGVDMVGSGIGIGKPVIRGLSYNRVVVYSQGVRLENQQWGDEHGLGLTSMGIERVEIIKGPSSLIFGSDAMGGVIYLVPEKPASSNTFEGDWNSVFHSNTLGYTSNLGLKYSGSRFRFGVRGGYEEHGDYMDAHGDHVENSRFNNMGLNSFVGFNTDTWTSRINYSWIKSSIGIIEAHEEEEHEEHEEEEHGSERTPLEPFQQLNTHTISTQNTVFIGDSKLKFNLGYTFNLREEFEAHHHEEDTTAVEEEHEEGPALDMRLSTLTYDTKWYFPRTEHAEYILGVQGMYQRNANAGEEILIPDATTIDLGSAFMAKYDFEPWHFQLGIRYDMRTISGDGHTHITEEDTAVFAQFDNNYGSVNVAAGGTVHATEHLLVRLNIASGFRAPNLTELNADGAHHGASQYLRGDLNLKSEQNVEVDLSAHWHREHITADISGFYNRVNNYIYLNPADTMLDSLPVYDYVQDNAVLFGGEAGFDLHPHPLDWLHIRSTFSAVLGELVNGPVLPLIPSMKWNNSLRVELEELGPLAHAYLYVGYDYSFLQDRTALPELPTDAYGLVNAGLGFEIPMKDRSIEFGVTCTNLTGEEYFDHLSRLKYAGIFNPGRNISFRLTVPFGAATGSSAE